MSSYNEHQEALLNSIEKREPDPKAVTGEMIMAHKRCKRATADRIMRDKVESGEAVWCWAMNSNGRLIKAIKVKSG